MPIGPCLSQPFFCPELNFNLLTIRLMRTTTRSNHSFIKLAFPPFSSYIFRLKWIFRHRRKTSASVTSDYALFNGIRWFWIRITIFRLRSLFIDYYLEFDLFGGGRLSLSPGSDSIPTEQTTKADKRRQESEAEETGETSRPDSTSTRLHPE